MNGVPYRPGRGMEILFTRTASFLHGPKFSPWGLGQNSPLKGGPKFPPENFSQKFSTLDFEPEFLLKERIIVTKAMGDIKVLNSSWDSQY
jgi:hypothetical protein